MSVTMLRDARFVLSLATVLLSLGAGLAASPTEKQTAHAPAKAAKPATPAPDAAPASAQHGKKAEAGQTPAESGSAKAAGHDAAPAKSSAGSTKAGSAKTSTASAHDDPPAAAASTADGGAEAKAAKRKATRAAESSTNDVVKRIETLMAAESAKKATSADASGHAAAPVRRTNVRTHVTVTAKPKPKPEPLLRWYATLAPGNISLRWDPELVPLHGAPERPGVHLSWSTPGPPRR